ncbi:MAG: isoaspartyl peptidase/L-asparaginase [Chitinophagaceae bacterium]|nr:MAG: isoaspartyl peptidase/L-asparaginase [Chitinophagaceae bacterium]
MTKHKYSIAIHGGAGNYNWDNFDKAKQNAYFNGLKSSIEAAVKVLKDGGSALEASILAVEHMENNAIFNAGRGSVFTKDASIEMDASVMCGQKIKSGSLAAVKGIKNPIRLAEKILNWGKHNFICGSSAHEFAALFDDIEIVDEDYFKTENRFTQLQKALETNEAALDHNLEDVEEKGTVGAVALDSKGNLAAATSTGGMTGKWSGRIGDSGVPGAGNYAKNGYAAVSCTGTGEAFTNLNAAARLIHMMEFGRFTLKDAANLIIQKDLVNMGGYGGLIAIDNKGNIECPYNSKGMFHAFSKENTEINIFTS